ncbi:MAG TPA: hypothetical protein PLP17_16750, partial [Oligoflexia bacterium]|nr:hypothetical protein [Oligoflexia bacterium]
MYRLFAFSSFAAFVIGVSAAITQLVLLREFLGVFAGIEIIIGIILGTWLILTACGSLFAQILAKGREPFSWLSRGLVASPLIGPLGLLGIRTIRSAHTSGLVFSISEAMFYSVLVLLPYCLLAGLLLALCARTAALEQSAGTASQVYIADTVGSTVGGLAYGFLLVHIVNPFAVLAIPAILCLAASAVISHDKGGNKSSLPPVT